MVFGMHVSEVGMTGLEWHFAITQNDAEIQRQHNWL